MKIWIYRHGRTEGNIKKQYIGRTDQPLCPQGRQEAKAAGSYPYVPLVYASPMKRAMETAHILFPNACVIPCPGLREMDFGAFEGKCYEELEGQEAYQNWLESLCEADCPAGENKQAFTKRCCQAFEEIVQEALKGEEENIYIVAHGGTIMSLLSVYAVPRQPYFAWMADNCEGFLLELQEKTWLEKKELLLCKSYPKTSYKA